MGSEDSVGRFKKLLSTPTPLTTPEPSCIKVSEETLREVDELFKQYSDEVWECEDLADYSKAIYIDNATNFIRWIKGNFKPGAAGLKPRRRRGER